MDTAHALITDYPGREVNLVAGRGTFFANRDLMFPAGVAKWWSGTLDSPRLATELSRRFDGTNEAEVHDWFRANFGIHPTPRRGELPRRPAVGGGEQDDRRRPQPRRDGLLRGCGRPQRLDRDGVPQRVDQDDPTRQLDSQLHGIPSSATPIRHMSPTFPPAGRWLSIHPRSSTLHLPAFHGLLPGASDVAWTRSETFRCTNSIGC